MQKWNNLNKFRPLKTEKVVISNGYDVRVAVYDGEQFVSVESAWISFPWEWWLPLPSLPSASGVARESVAIPQDNGKTCIDGLIKEWETMPAEELPLIKIKGEKDD